VRGVLLSDFSSVARDYATSGQLGTQFTTHFTSFTSTKAQLLRTLLGQCLVCVHLNTCVLGRVRDEFAPIIRDLLVQKCEY